MRIEPGRIQALIGENGAGKSTLIRLLSGVSQPSSGAILLDGHEVRFASPGAAARHGIGVVYQERHLIPGFSVAENIYLGEMPRSRSGWVNYAAANRGAAEELRRSASTSIPRSTCRGSAPPSNRSWRSPAARGLRVAS